MIDEAILASLALKYPPTPSGAFGAVATYIWVYQCSSLYSTLAKETPYTIYRRDAGRIPLGLAVPLVACWGSAKPASSSERLMALPAMQCGCRVTKNQGGAVQQRGTEELAQSLR